MDAIGPPVRADTLYFEILSTVDQFTNAAGRASLGKDVDGMDEVCGDPGWDKHLNLWAELVQAHGGLLDADTAIFTWTQETVDSNVVINDPTPSDNKLYVKVTLVKSEQHQPTKTVTFSLKVTDLTTDNSVESSISFKVTTTDLRLYSCYPLTDVDQSDRPSWLLVATLTPTATPTPEQTSSGASMKRSVRSPAPFVVAASDARVEEGTDAVFTIRLPYAASDAVKLRWKLHKLEGEASPGVDYVDKPISGWVEVRPGETSATFRVRTIEDSDAERDEMFKVSLAPPSSGLYAGARLSSVDVFGAIIDDDGTPTPTPIPTPTATPAPTPTPISG